MRKKEGGRRENLSWVDRRGSPWETVEAAAKSSYKEEGFPAASSTVLRPRLPGWKEEEDRLLAAFFFSRPTLRPPVASLSSPQSHPVALVFVEGAWEERRGRKPISSLSWVALSSSLSFSLLSHSSSPVVFGPLPTEEPPSPSPRNPFSMHAAAATAAGRPPTQPTLRRSVEKEYYYEEGDGGRAASFYVGRPNSCYTFYTFV